MKAQIGLVIRQADADDYAAISALETHCFSDDAQSPRSLRYLLRQAHAETLLAVFGPDPAGYLSLLFRRNSRVARLYSIAVNSGYRGHGVGQGLVVAAERIARARNLAQIRLEVRVSNRNSRRLFARLGYQESGQLLGYYKNRNGTTEDGVRMQKNLQKTLTAQA